MKNSESDPLSSCLVYEDMLPLSWEIMDETPEVNCARVVEHNEHVLRCVNLLSDQVKGRVDDESEAESALVRLEAKVNLVLELLSKLSRDNNPQPVRVRVAATGVEWICSEQQPSKGDRIWIKLHIDSRVPEAIQLAALVEAVSDTATGAAIFAKFEDMGEVVRDQFEKLIFRHHRRMVAHSKSK